MRIFKPPEALPKELRGSSPPFSVFLAGTIEMGEGERWQERFERELADLPGLLLNPRRDAWDDSWVQRFDNAPFREQVQWELEGLELASLIVMYLAPGSKSPISLLEFGLHAQSKRMLVCAPEGFWRRGNIEVVAHRYGIPLVDSLEKLLERVRSLAR